MKHFHKISLTALLMAVLPLVAQALPFEPTSDPNASTTKWYYLIINNLYVQGAEQYFGSTPYYATSLGSAPSGTPVDQWCFVNDGTGKYKAFNRKYKRYLCDDGYLESEINHETSVYYRERTSDTFYLLRSYDSDGATVILNLYYDAEENALMTEGTTGNVLHGYFSAQFAAEGGEDPNPEPTWTRHDKYGVGYRIIGGGQGAFVNESTDKLCDNDASTKYYGIVPNCWVTIEASEPVAVSQYSIVTANDTHSYPNRNVRSWWLAGSNDNANYIVIDRVSDYPNIPFTNQEEVVFRPQLNSTGKFRYFRFQCSEGAEQNVQLGEVWINEQPHSWLLPETTQPTCGVHGTQVSKCAECNALNYYYIPPTDNHTYVDGVCSVCGKAENVTILLDNGQVNPYRVKYFFSYRKDDQTWPDASDENWNTPNFDDTQWNYLTMPTASVGHSAGPFNYLKYNSHWYGEYNCYWMRRPFHLDRVDPTTTYTLRYVHDDNLWVYVNGQEVLHADGWTATYQNSTWDTAYEEFVIPASAFRAGDNVLAIYIQQNWGGAYFDCELRAENTSTGVRGDVTGDGQVDIADVNAVINMMLGKVDKTSAADVTGDGSVDIADVNTIINIMLGKD